MWKNIKRWFVLLGYSKQIKNKILDCVNTLEYIESQLADRNKVLRQQEARLRSIVNEAAGELKNHRQIVAGVRSELNDIVKNHETYRVEIERLQSQLQIAEEVVIPELTAAVKNAQQRWETETAMSARRQFIQQANQE